MKSVDVTMVRIYITESSKLLKSITSYLHDDAQVRGISVFRAISGSGDSGKHEASLVDLSLNLPLTIEFFDHPEKIKTILAHIGNFVKSEHIVFWNAQSNVENTLNV